MRGWITEVGGQKSGAEGVRRRAEGKDKRR